MILGEFLYQFVDGFGRYKYYEVILIIDYFLENDYNNDNDNNKYLLSVDSNVRYFVQDFMFII